jgi:hypothetical protein
MKMIEPFRRNGHNSLKAIQVITEQKGHLLIEMR